MIGRLSREHWPWLVAGTIHRNKRATTTAFSKARDLVGVQRPCMSELPSALRQRV